MERGFSQVDQGQAGLCWVAGAPGVGPGLWLVLEVDRCYCLSLSSTHTHTLGFPVTPSGSPAGSPQRKASTEAAS